MIRFVYRDIGRLVQLQWQRPHPVERGRWQMVGEFFLTHSEWGLFLCLLKPSQSLEVIEDAGPTA